MNKLSKFLTLVLILVMCFGIVGCDILLGGRAVQLSAPTNVKTNGNVLSWNFVEHAIGYTVKIIEGGDADINDEGSEIPVAETQYSFTSLADGEYTVGVKARGDGVLYSNSAYSVIKYTHKNRVADEGNENEIIGPFGAFDEVNTKSSFLGYGINIIDADSISSKNVLMNYAIFDMNKLMNENLLKSNEHSSKLEEIEGSSVEEFKAKMSNSSSVSAGTAVSASGNIYGVQASADFSLSAGVSNSFTQTTANTYSHYFLELIAENRNYWLILQSEETRYKELLSEEFKNDLYNPAVSAADLFSKYGTHVLLGAAMGGNITMFYTIYSEDSTVEESTFLEVATRLKSSAKASYGSYSAGASSSLETKDISETYAYAAAHNIKIEKNIIINGGSGKFGMQDEESIRANYTEWQKSLETHPVLSGIKDANSLYPIWKLIDTTVPGGAERAESLVKYFVEYGEGAYRNMLDLHSIKPPVAPESVDNIKVKENVNYTEGETVQIKAGDSFRITYSINPGNASKYYKSFVSNNDFVSVDASGNVKVSEDIPHGTVVTITITVDKIKVNVTLVAVRSYNVLFNTGIPDITVDSLIGMDVGSYIDEPDISIEGRILEGWYKDLEKTEKWDFESDYVTEHITLYAKWVDIKPVVTFNAMGGSEVAEQVVAYNAVAVNPKAPTRSGYSFVGWYTDEECTDAFDFATKLTGNIELFAKWDIKTYTVTFITDGTDVAPRTTDIEKDYLIPEQTTEKTYYVFIGWYKDNGQKFDFSEKVTEDITLTARWELERVPVRFMDDDGTTELAVVYTDLSKGFKIEGAPSVTKDGYVFMGWRESLSSVDMVSDFSGYEFSTDGKNYVFYARWIDTDHAYPVPFVINYIFEDGSIAHEPFINKNDYYFEDTYCIKSPEITGFTPDIIEVKGDIPVGGITVNVTYKPLPYKLTVNYVLSDGGAAPASHEEWYKFGSQYSVTSPIVVGYTPVLTAVSGTMGAENTEITVTYQPNVYSIVYDSNGGSGSMDPTQMVYGVDDELRTNLFEREGYIFVGWNTKSDASGVMYNNGENVINLSTEQGGEVRLYAMWVSVAIDLYSTAEGQVKVVTDISWAGFNGLLDFGQTFTIPAPRADYYKFEGWYTEDGRQLTDGTGKSISTWDILGEVRIEGRWIQTYEGYTYITTTDEFIAIADNMAGNYLLVNDIDLGAYWTPIGSYYWQHNNKDEILPPSFNGVLDGQGHTITYSNIVSNTLTAHTDYAFGLFGISDNAVFRNIYLNCSITTEKNPNCRECFMGGFVGTARNTIFENCHVANGSVIKNEDTDETYYEFLVGMHYTGATYAGGLVGDARYCTFKNCSNGADVNAAGFSAYSGGFAGNSYNCEYINPTNSGNITSTHGAWVWGLNGNGALYGKNNEPWLRHNGESISFV
ncbi:MAG: InlB B-repeat-containing protein [Clostridia bacterium]|nr:InlB B-repeat-containing protein [Clostridia bacterium]